MILKQHTVVTARRLVRSPTLVNKLSQSSASISTCPYSHTIKAQTPLQQNTPTHYHIFQTDNFHAQTNRLDTIPTPGDAAVVRSAPAPVFNCFDHRQAAAAPVAPKVLISSL